MASKSVVNLLSTEDYEPVATFLEKATRGVFKRGLWLDRFEYWWDNNPAAKDNRVARGWVLREKNGEIGGFLGNIPVKYYINGQEKIVCSATSWYVDDKFKDRSLDLLVPYLKQKGPTILLDTTPLEKVERILCKLGFNSLKREWLREDALYPIGITDFWNFFAERTISDKIIVFLIKLAGLLVIPAIKFYQLFRLTRSDKRYTFREIKKFSETYTFLWLKLREKYRILALRDATALNWYFFGTNQLRSSRKVIELRYIDEIIGYVAVKEVGRSVRDKVYYSLEVVDMVIFNSHNHTSAYDVALKGLLWLARNSDKKITFVLINPFVENIKRCLLKHGYIIIRGKSRFLYKQTGEQDTDLYESFDKGCYATPLDGDRCFFP